MRRFAAGAYVITWVLLAPWFYLYSTVFHGSIPSWMWALAPAAFVGGWGPSVAALWVASRAEGRAAVLRLFASLLDWRHSLRWYVLALGLPPAAAAVSVGIADGGLDTLRHFDPVSALVALPLTYALALPFGPLGEELGWRGFALPRVLDRFGPWKATLILGATWTFWHVPMMLFMPGASMPSFMPLSAASVALYLCQLTAESAVMTWLFLGTRGSVFFAVLAHLAFNTAESAVSGGLPPLSDLQMRRAYFANVAVLAATGLVSLAIASRYRLRGRIGTVGPA